MIGTCEGCLQKDSRLKPWRGRKDATRMLCPMCYNFADYLYNLTRRGYATTSKKVLPRMEGCANSIPDVKSKKIGSTVA